MRDLSCRSAVCLVSIYRQPRKLASSMAHMGCSFEPIYGKLAPSATTYEAHILNKVGRRYLEVLPNSITTMPRKLDVAPIKAWRRPTLGTNLGADISTSTKFLFVAEGESALEQN